MPDNIKFNKYDSKSSFLESGDVDKVTFSVVKTGGCNSNENNGDTGDIKDLYIHNTKMTDVYNSRKVDNGNLKTNVTVGGVPAGTSLSELTEMSLGEVLDRIFFKTYNPSVGKDVSASVSYSPVRYMVGKTYPVVTPSMISVNNGTYVRDDGTGTKINVGEISGGLDSYTVTYEPEDRVVKESGNKITVSINMKPGVAPKDSDGNPYGTAYAGGTLIKNVSIVPYYPWYATTTLQTVDGDKIPNLIEQPAANNMGCSDIAISELKLCSGSSANPQTIRVPGTIDEIYVEVSGQWQNYDSFGSEWSVSYDDNYEYSTGLYKKYTTYQHTGVERSGDLKLKFKVKKY